MKTAIVQVKAKKFLKSASEMARIAGKWTFRKCVLLLYLPIRTRLLALVPFRLPNQLLAPQHNRDYIFWGVIDWHFRHQRPQQLARQIADTRRRVFYISPNFRRDIRSGFKVEALDENGSMVQVTLFLEHPRIIYSNTPSAQSVMQLRRNMGKLLAWANIQNPVSIVQHPFWYDIANAVPNSRLIYDCIDHHSGFENGSNGINALEQKLLENADITVATSEWLYQYAAKYSRSLLLIRNAVDYEHFSQSPSFVFKDPENRRIIGYFGAIARWFDTELVAEVARAFEDCCILLVGADTAGARRRLGHLKNVVFIGEVPYADLPYYLHAFHIAMLPFKVSDLTLATNPVKAYEYLAAGKPVVSVKLPEMTALGSLVKEADSPTAFVSEISKALSNGGLASEILARKKFASENTWRHRAEILINCVEANTTDPLVSVIVVTYNNIEFTRACLRSVELFSEYPNLEVIVVDNASTDGSVEFLQAWCQGKCCRRLILNDDNRGFAAANNQGLRIAKGEFVVLLNNDTYVTRGWIRGLLRHLKYDRTIGLVGPVTNNISNEAKVALKYNTMEEMLQAARSYTSMHMGENFDIQTLAFYCVMIPKEVVDHVGLLDESYGLGFFEDDDYCRRVELAGMRIVCAEDVFIHHHLSASFMKLDRDARRALFNENKSKYEKKWGKWSAHIPRKRRVPK